MCRPHEWGFWEATPSLGETCLMVAEKRGTVLEEPSPSSCFAREGCLDQSQAKRTALSFKKCPCTSRWIF